MIKTMQFNRRFLFPLALVAGGISACSSHTGVPPRHEVRVQKHLERLAIVNNGQRPAVLSRAENIALRRLVSYYKENGDGPVTVNYPGNQPYVTKSQALARVLAQGLERHGLRASNIVLQPYRVKKDTENPVTSILLLFDRYQAILPRCAPPPGVDLGTVNINGVTPNFGCVGLSNLAAMVARPGDLLMPHAIAPADTRRRDVVLEKYRQGQPTDTQRSNQEKASIREVSN